MRRDAHPGDRFGQFCRLIVFCDASTIAVHYNNCGGLSGSWTWQIHISCASYVTRKRSYRSFPNVLPYRSAHQIPTTATSTCGSQGWRTSHPSIHQQDLTRSPCGWDGVGLFPHSKHAPLYLLFILLPVEKRDLLPCRP